MSRESYFQDRIAQGQAAREAQAGAQRRRTLADATPAQRDAAMAAVPLGAKQLAGNAGLSGFSQYKTQPLRRRVYELPSTTAQKYAGTQPTKAPAAPDWRGPVAGYPLAAGIGKNGLRNYDNDSIRRMQMRDGQSADGAAAAPAAPAGVRRFGERAAPIAQAQGAMISGNTAGAEKERQARVSDLRSEMFRLGSLNSRGKRAMWQQMQGEIGGLTSQHYDTQNKRDMHGASLANETSNNNAALRERGMARYDDRTKFNDQMNWDVDKFTQGMDWEQTKTGLDWMRQMQADQANAQTGRLKAETERAKLAREDQRYADDLSKLRYDQLKASNPDMKDDEILQQVAFENLRNGGNPTTSHLSSLGYTSFKDEVASEINKGSSLGDRVRNRRGFTPYGDGRLPAGEIPDLTDYNIERTEGGFLGPMHTASELMGKSYKRNVVEVPNDNGLVTATFVDDVRARDLARARKWEEREKAREKAEGRR